jgi:hypothetical protein
MTVATQPNANSMIFQQLKDSITADQASVAEVDLARSEIANALGGEFTGVAQPAPAKKPAGSRPKNEESTKELVEKVTGSEPMSKGEIAIAVLKAGYKTVSDGETFIASVYSNAIAPLVKDGVLEAIGERGDTKYVKKNRKKK